MDKLNLAQKRIRKKAITDILEINENISMNYVDAFSKLELLIGHRIGRGINARRTVLRDLTDIVN